ncbi:MAG: hypothetical protein JWR68_1767 [Polaromonas sp.]|nr:hypothetical protein [Polaromonas sp.]
MHNLLKPTVKLIACKLLPVPSSATPLFALGRIAMTQSATALLERHHVNVSVLLARFQAGDFGSIGIEDRSANAQAMAKIGRILGLYRLLDKKALDAMTPEEQRHAPAVLVSTNGYRTTTTILTQRDI